MSRFTLPRGLAAAALAIAASSAFAQGMPALPEGKIAIHYNRCDNNYDGWGVHLWKNPSIPLTGVEWQNPMMPTGKSDFGVYWHRDLSEFGSSGTVNYIIHKGDTKDQGAKDKKFDGKTIKQAYINSGDNEIYTSLEDAKKARAANPCK